MPATDWDIVIVGGGPVGSTTSTLLKKYNPDLRVLVLEKERFPREHVGESQLPAISGILDEMGVWDKVEAAEFPIKVGVSYTWGRNADQWDFDFVPIERFRDEARPAKYTGQRRYTAFQVERSEYDKILLDHAASLGVEVWQETRVAEVMHEGDRIDGFRLHDDRVITARWYVDGSGAVGLFRRALDIPGESPKELRNIAIWDYWENTDWAVEIGVGGTRVQVRSLPWGWMWFIPLGPTRTSIGLITHAEHYRKSGMSPDELYEKALREQPEIAGLIKNGTRTGDTKSCKDWSHVCDKIIGENWMLAGEAAGFADPVLAAGMTLAHNTARDAAYTILELDRGELDEKWLRERFNEKNRLNIKQHIRFAQFWYASNSNFTELQEHCSKIAAEAGIRLEPQAAWRWLSQGGFINENAARPGLGTFDIASAKQLISIFDEKARDVGLLSNGYNVFKINLTGAKPGFIGVLQDGRITQQACWFKNGRCLPDVGYFGLVRRVLEQTSDAFEMIKMIEEKLRERANELGVSIALQALEVMIQEGWVRRSKNSARPILQTNTTSDEHIRYAVETERIVRERGTSGRVRFNSRSQPDV